MPSVRKCAAKKMRTVTAVTLAALTICASEKALAEDDLCNVKNGCLYAILSNSSLAAYGYFTDRVGLGETAKLMWCQLAVTVYSWRRPNVDPNSWDIYVSKYAVRENERGVDGSKRPIDWLLTAASLGSCVGELRFADPDKLAKAQSAAAQWARTIVLAPEPPEIPDVVPVPPPGQR